MLTLDHGKRGMIGLRPSSTEVCESCGETFCPGCMNFHRADHAKPPQVERLDIDPLVALERLQIHVQPRADSTPRFAESSPRLIRANRPRELMRLVKKQKDGVPAIVARLRGVEVVRTSVLVCKKCSRPSAAFWNKS